jgi:hypothetical protein
MARTTPAKIDPGRVEGLARLGCTQTEIADYLGVDERKLARHKKPIARGRATRHIRLRKLQWESAEGGSVPMQTFLGKHELGQGDEKPVEERKVIVRREVKRG